MAGHSKWAQIKRSKAVVDAKRGKIFSRISKDISLAAREGGGDPAMNPRLRTILLKAKQANMPADNIDRAIKKGTGELPGVSYEQLVYEGYAPGGVAVIVEVTTDNKNRTASEVRSLFSKYNGNLAGAGAVSFLFNRQGQFLVSREAVSEDRLMEVCLEAGAEDIRTHPEFYEVLAPVASYEAVSHALEEAGIACESSELAYLPQTQVPIADLDTARQVNRLVEVLDEQEDVQNVFHNADFDAQVQEALQEA
ncbi:MAG: YebC/PmpR family DNA-binding transcriptional regulator [Puniceicoccaceae bacterium]|nr:MAG: YebC/PmpR family DNA-binding transcriptional regulator [Puniceicoccaceae bacterium]